MSPWLPPLALICKTAQAGTQGSESLDPEDTGGWGPPNTIPVRGQEGDAQPLGLQEESAAAGSASSCPGKATWLGKPGLLRVQVSLDPTGRRGQGRKRSAQWASLPRWLGHRTPQDSPNLQLCLILVLSRTRRCPGGRGG